MNLTLEQFAEYARRFRQTELSVLRAEYALMYQTLSNATKKVGQETAPPFPAPRDYKPPPPVIIYQRIKTMDAVRSVFNGHAMDAEEVKLAVQQKFPELNFTNRNINASLCHLKEAGEVKSFGRRGNFQWFKLATLVALMAALCGCQTSKQKPPLLMDSGKSAAITTRYTPPQPPKLPPAPTGPAVRAPLPPRAILSWSSLPTAQAYRVDYGLAVNAMTNSVVTSTTSCHILGLVRGQKYFYRVREINGGVYGTQVSSGMVETK